jgi:hypothetical protein
MSTKSLTNSIARLSVLLIIVAFAVIQTTPTLSSLAPVAYAASCSASPYPGPMYLSGSYVKTPAITVTCSPAVHRIRVYGYLNYNGVNQASPDVTCPVQGYGYTATSCTMPAQSKWTGTGLTGWTWAWYYNFTP